MDHPKMYRLTTKGLVPLRSTHIHETIQANIGRPKAETYEAIHTLICHPIPVSVAMMRDFGAGTELLGTIRPLFPLTVCEFWCHIGLGDTGCRQTMLRKRSQQTHSNRHALGTLSNWMITQMARRLRLCPSQYWNVVFPHPSD